MQLASAHQTSSVMHVDVIYKGCCTDILSKFKVFCVWKHDIQLNTVTSCIYYKPIFCLFITASFFFFFFWTLLQSLFLLRFSWSVITACTYSYNLLPTPSSYRLLLLHHTDYFSFLFSHFPSTVWLSNVFSPWISWILQLRGSCVGTIWSDVSHILFC